MQRRVEQADDDREAVHRLEDAVEVVALKRQQDFFQHTLELIGVTALVGENGFLELFGAVTEEHMLGAAQADPLSAVSTSAGGLFGIIGICPDLQAANIVCPRKDSLKIGLIIEGRRNGGNLTQENTPGAAVQ